LILAERDAASVTYLCPKLGTSWTPFTATLVATAGPACCKTVAQATATVAVTQVPVVTVEPVFSPVGICKGEEGDSVVVAFRVETSNSAPVTVPNQLNASDSSRVCTLGEVTAPGLRKTPAKRSEGSTIGE
jgi:hypothetical protein